MRRLDGVGDVGVDLEKGSARITPADGETFDPTGIPGAIEDAGFGPGPLEVEAIGTLVEHSAELRLEMDGVLAVVTLRDGARVGELVKRRDLLGGRVRVVGRFAKDTDEPPSLTVESWKRVPRDP